MPLLESNGFLPDLDAIPADVLKKARVLWICYPNNPTGAVAEPSFFEKVVKFAQNNRFSRWPFWAGKGAEGRPGKPWVWGT